MESFSELSDTLLKINEDDDLSKEFQKINSELINPFETENYKQKARRRDSLEEENTKLKQKLAELSECQLKQYEPIESDISKLIQQSAITMSKVACATNTMALALSQFADAFNEGQKTYHIGKQTIIPMIEPIKDNLKSLNNF